MLQDVLRLSRAGLERYRSAGLIPTLRSAKRHLFRFSSEYVRQRLLRGAWQFDCLTSLRYRVQKRKHAAPADPYARIRVTPGSTDHYVTERAVPRDLGLGQIRGGDWDLEEREPLESLSIYVGLKQRFEDGRDWERTAYYESAKRTFERGGSKAGCESLQQWKRVRLAFEEELFMDIKENGYQPNFEAGHDVPEIDHRSTDSRYKHRLEPLVAIGRDGAVYVADGYHRWTIAEILDLELIPVNVLARHREWQRIRNEISEADGTPKSDPDLRKHLGHPDLKDVLTER